ncbi:hypothetical protein A2Z33_01990 [Candidatus Gottesmanbacteria bacterium RBG_16_52_11]|uniref:Uncharacterized protein n=1 Tax=Candidatus Gottesmanbacteria bacterium RBG_16_52_11 TaxID=1798374 RepID=A0A1F5YR13_9BACT|nr:MAG: hypothetical protein A2Z33_01990 [Candidatus Gottesmanbacteria bacterium RBG_16_52_11]
MKETPGFTPSETIPVPISYATRLGDRIQIWFDTHWNPQDIENAWIDAFHRIGDSLPDEGKRDAFVKVEPAVALAGKIAGIGAAGADSVAGLWFLSSGRRIFHSTARGDQAEATIGLVADVADGFKNLAVNGKHALTRNVSSRAQQSLEFFLGGFVKDKFGYLGRNRHGEDSFVRNNETLVDNRGFLGGMLLVNDLGAGIGILRFAPAHQSAKLTARAAGYVGERIARRIG